MIIVNFKTYESGTGDKAVALARICEKVQLRTGVAIIPAVQAVDVYRISQQVTTPVFVQHFDPVGHGKNTGSILAEAVKMAGARGALINHAEKQLHLSVVHNTVQRAREVGLTSVVCVQNDDMVHSVAAVKPDYIAIEPPELIGGHVSVISARPELIEAAVKKARGVPVLCGAGVKTKEDVQKALSLGAKGVLLASGVTEAKDPEKVLLGLAEGFL